MLNDYNYNEEYYSWLINKICEYDYDPSCYQLVLEKLFSTEFYPLIERDENRVKDGLELYFTWLREECPFDGPYELPEDHFCSVLELMIALSERLEYEYLYDPDDGNHISVCFWAMMESLGLLNMDDERYNEAKVEDILVNFINRTYDFDGYGNIFMTEDPDFDERNHEIWAQSMKYLSEFWYD